MKKIDANELGALSRWIGQTAPEELDCSQFLELVAGYIERLRDADGNPPGYESVAQHLLVCPECREEFEALCEALGLTVDGRRLRR